MSITGSNFRVRIWTIGGALLVVLMLALGITQLTAAQTSPMKVLPPNPDAGLTNAEVMQRHAEARSWFWARREAWRADFITRDIDPRSLPQGPMAVSYGPMTLPAAVQSADLIVVATSRTMQFDLQGTQVILTVERSLKGAAGPELTIDQAGGPEPNADWTTARLVYS
jgi:hypothetical protein